MNEIISFRGDVAHTNHPELTARKQLAARALLARNLGLLAKQNRLPTAALRKLAKTASYHIDVEAEDSRTSLTDFLGAMVGAVKERWGKDQDGADSASAEHSAIVDLVLGQLSQEAEKVSCQSCKDQRREHTHCTGKAGDAYIVARRAVCLDFVTEIFAFLVELAEAHYKPLLQPSPTGALVIRLKTIHTHDRKLGASTRFSGDGPQCRRAEVLLNLPIKFNATHLKRLPYSLFHEIFVHAPEAWETPAPRPTVRVDTHERCPFREGFVDAAARYVLRQALRNRQLVPTAHHDLAEHYRRETDTAHKDRLSHGPEGVDFDDDQDDLIINRESGALIFDRLADNNLGEEAVRLAICLNRLPLPEDDRTRLIVALRTMTDALCWDEPDRDPGSIRWIELHRQVLEAARRGAAAQLQELLAKALDPGDF
jgi:hypothetical protein